ncbi:hypothetical protein ACZ91_15600 [Streptomyces regensis]|uniref:Acetyltransferase AlgX (SGNH hydrolase-like protein) n=1 Tax=Prauserella rugosa TaxID=43354 RepID=A0A660CJD2_9PSEU|nr:hypothetical protein ACZ91_15600 [Streptomyces regensis]TWH21115.1 acetyltransferase AlgX (SGNH hydrolase-like protein) [Prauserella rugosa]
MGRYRVRVTDAPQKLPPVHEAWLPREHALYRPRHGRRQLTALLCAVVFFSAPALMWVFGGRPGEIENRALAGFPSISDGWGFFTGFPQWATDQLVFRAGAIDAADGISHGLFGEPAPMGQHGDGGPIPGVPDGPQAGDGDGGDSGNGDRSEDDQGGSAGYVEVIEGKDGWLYYGDDVKAKCFPQRPVEETLQRLDRIRHAVEASGRRFVLTIAPDKTTMVPQHLPDSYAGKDCAPEATKKFWRLAEQQRSFQDLRPSLRDAADQLGEPPYYANDTHWTDDGAVMLTRDVAEAIQPGVTDSWRSDGVGWSTTQGDLASMLGRTEPKASIRYELKPDGRTDRTHDPLTRFDGPERYDADAGVDIEGVIGAPTALIGDSFTFASSRYLPAAFNDLTLLSYPQLGKHKKDTLDVFVRSEVVVVQTVERSVAEGDLPLIDEGFVKELEQAMQRNPIR